MARGVGCLKNVAEFRPRTTGHYTYMICVVKIIINIIITRPEPPRARSVTEPARCAEARPCTTGNIFI